MRTTTLTRTALAGGGAALLLASLVWMPSAASAAEIAVDDVELTWSLNDESNWSSFQPGAYNFLSAGIVGKTSAGDTVTESEWQQSSGEVTIEKEQTDGTFADATWAGLFTNIAGETIQAPYLGQNGPSGNRVKLAGGTGTLDPAADNASISWDGSFSVIYYQGLTQWYATDLRLEIVGSSGWLTATLGGYGTSMDDANAFVQLDEVENVRLAQLSNVDVTAEGLEVTPDYPLLTIDGSDTRTRSWPADFVAFQGLTGQGSYWYASGGTADARKTPTAITVSVPVEEADPYFVPIVQNATAEGFEVEFEGYNFPSGFLDVFLVSTAQDLTTRPTNDQLVSTSAIAYPEDGYIANEFTLTATAARLANHEPSDTYLLVAWGQSFLNSGAGFVGSTEVVLTEEQYATVFAAAAEVTADPVDVTVQEGLSTAFTAAASGVPAPAVQWESSTDGETWSAVEGATSSTLTIDAVSIDDDGTRYRAVFTNVNGEDVSEAATLTVTERVLVAPDAPTGVVAIAGTGSVTVGWTPSVENDQTPVTGYEIALVDAAGGFRVLAVGAEETSVTFADVAVGDYSVLMVATSEAGFSDVSETVSVTVAAETTDGTDGTVPDGTGADGGTTGTDLAETGWFTPSESDLTTATSGAVSVPATAVAGSEITIDVGVAYAGQQVHVFAFSTPQSLGVHTVADDGTVTVTLPDDLTGAHLIAVYLTDGTLIGWDSIAISAASESSLASTGAEAGGLLAGALVLMLLGAAALARHRSRQPA